MAKNKIMERIEKAKTTSQPRLSICFKVLPEVDERIRKLAEKTGLSMSRVVDVATASLEDSIKRAEKKKVG
mgnify:CR=1 FL=1|jgi:predicted transcriptional regulator